MNQENSQLKIGIILNYINMILGNLSPIFYTPIMLSILGQNEYGLYKLSSSVTSYLSLVSLGIGSAITRYLIKSREEDGTEAEERTLGLFMIIFQIIAILSFIIGCAIMLNLHIWYASSLSITELHRMKILVFLMVCNTALGFSQSPYLSIVSSHERFVFLQSMNILSTCAVPLLNLLALFLGFASIGMAISSLFIGVLIRCGYSIYVRKAMEIHPRYDNLPVNLLKEILFFSFWIFIANVVGQLYNATDTILIGAVPELTTSGVAVYSVGSTFNSIVFSLTIGISSLLAPRTNQMVFSGATNNELTDLSIKVGRLQCYIITLLVSGFISFGKPFIMFYAGHGYEDAYWVAVLMMIPNMIPLVQSVCLNVIVAQNKHQFRSIVYLGIAIANVIGTWLLMKPLGIIGAALMTGLALVVGQGFIMNWYYHKKTGLDMVRFWKQLGKIYTIPSLLCIFTLFIAMWIDLNNIYVWILGVLIYTLLFCILNWNFVMNTYEKNIIISPLKKIRHSISKR